MRKPKDLISVKSFKKGVKLYEKNILPKFAKGQTKGVWFDLEEVKAFIDYIEKEAYAKKLEVSGIRFHIMAKDEDNYPMTLAWVPTVKKINEKGEAVDVSLDILHSDSNKLFELNSVESPDDPEDENGGILNFGALCPPGC